MKPWALAAGALALAGEFRFEELDGGRLALKENGGLVFVYNYGPQLPAGVPEDRRRAGYLHPVVSPGGVVLTDDFPRDHYHHRGVFWSWPVVRSAHRTVDLWTLKGGGQRFERWVVKPVGGKQGSLAVENGWHVDGRRIVAERVDIRVAPAKDLRRELEITVELTATGDAVEIAGSPDQQKGYGGVCARFAPRTDTVIRTDRGVLPGDEDHGGHAWAELEATFGGRRAGLRITSHPSNPGFPSEWCLRQYGFVGASFPGVRPYRLEPGRPLKLRYTVTVFDVGASAPTTATP